MFGQLFERMKMFIHFVIETHGIKWYYFNQNWFNSGSSMNILFVQSQSTNARWSLRLIETTDVTWKSADWYSQNEYQINSWLANESAQSIHTGTRYGKSHFVNIELDSSFLCISQLKPLHQLYWRLSWKQHKYILTLCLKLCSFQHQMKYYKTIKLSMDE